MEKYQLSKHFHFLWPVNVSSFYWGSICFRLVNICFTLFHVKLFSCNMLIIGSTNTVRKYTRRGEKLTSAYLLLSQHTSLSPDGKLLIIVGDNPDVMLVDSDTGKVIIWFVFFFSPCTLFLRFGDCKG